MEGIPMRTAWETRDAARLIGVNGRRLQGWVEKGLLTPTTEGAGKGSRRLFTLGDLVMGVVLVALQDAVGQRSAVTRTLSIARAQAEGLVEQLTTGVIARGSDNVLVIGQALALLGSLDGQAGMLRAFADGAQTVTVVPLEKPLTGLLRRLYEAEGVDREPRIALSSAQRELLARIEEEERKEKEEA